MPFMEREKYTAPKLTGPILTRARARELYSEIVAELDACGDADMLNAYLLTIGEELIQYENELERLWVGDGYEFKGLNKEIQEATARCRVFW